MKLAEVDSLSPRKETLSIIQKHKVKQQELIEELQQGTQKTQLG